MGTGKDWNRRREKEPGGDSLSWGKGEPLLPPWDCPKLLPVPGPGGFGQLTQPPGERHTQINTETHRHIESQMERQTQIKRGR